MKKFSEEAPVVDAQVASTPVNLKTLTPLKKLGNLLSWSTPRRPARPQISGPTEFRRVRETKISNVLVEGVFSRYPSPEPSPEPSPQTTQKIIEGNVQELAEKVEQMTFKTSKFSESNTILSSNLIRSNMN